MDDYKGKNFDRDLMSDRQKRIYDRLEVILSKGHEHLDREDILEVNELRAEFFASENEAERRVFLGGR